MIRTITVLYPPHTISVLAIAVPAPLSTAKNHGVPIASSNATSRRRQPHQRRYWQTLLAKEAKLAVKITDRSQLLKIRSYIRKKKKNNKKAMISNTKLITVESF